LLGEQKEKIFWYHPRDQDAVYADLVFLALIAVVSCINWCWPCVCVAEGDKEEGK
jgi:hypothetical protein